MNESLVARCARALTDMRRRRPLVHNITNYVVMDFSANALLAAGASPVMAHAVEEVKEMVALAGALVLNIGTLSRPWIDATRRGRSIRYGILPTSLVTMSSLLAMTRLFCIRFT